MKTQRGLGDRSQPGRCTGLPDWRPERALVWCRVLYQHRRRARNLLVAVLREHPTVCSEITNHGIDPIAVPLRVIESLDHERDGQVASPIRRSESKMLTRQDRSRIHGEVDRADDRRVEFSAPEPLDGDGQGLVSRGLVAGHGEARPTDPELARNPAGHESAERPHGSVGRQGRPSRLT